jgi:hypothetical protein
MSENPPNRLKRVSQRPDYHALNDGSDVEADPADLLEPPPKRPNCAISSLEPPIE